MRVLGHRWAGTGLAIALAVFNGLFAIQLIGLSYGRFTWEVWAQVYDPIPGSDMDGDGVKDNVDPNPNHFDPSGCFYDRSDGRIVPGGLIAPSGPGNLMVGLDGSNGCYQVKTDAPGTITLTIDRLPPHCVLDVGCPNHGTLVVNGLEIPGFLEDLGNPGFLLGGGQCTPYYLALQVSDPGDDVIGNNIPLRCTDRAAAPALSGWGWIALLLSLVSIGWLRLRRFTAARA
jgi:hypothetical protein